MKTVVIKYNAGNIQSVLFALERLSVNAEVTDDASSILSADRVIFPGVGEASSAMKYLRAKNLDNVITSLTQPVLGICLGMQLLCEHSEENNTSCLGIFKNINVKKFAPAENTTHFKVPQIGWNMVTHKQDHLFNKIPVHSYFYFVHGYYAELNDWNIGTTDYIAPYTSAMKKNNFYGVQFHPEKSAAAGEQLLKNFLSLS